MYKKISLLALCLMSAQFAFAASLSQQTDCPRVEELYSMTMNGKIAEDHFFTCEENKAGYWTMTDRFNAGNAMDLLKNPETKWTAMGGERWKGEIFCDYKAEQNAKRTYILLEKKYKCD